MTPRARLRSVLARLALALLVGLAPAAAALHAAAHAAPGQAAPAKKDAHGHEQGGPTCATCIAFAAGAAGLAGRAVLLAAPVVAAPLVFMPGRIVATRPPRPYASRAPPRASSVS